MEKQLFKIKKMMATLFLLIAPMWAIAQNSAVTGKITDGESGESLPGVSVIEKGTSNGVITDVDGNYRIELKHSPATLEFSMVGMTTQQLEAQSGATLNVVMNADIMQLEQVVVTGYSTQKKADLTGAVNVVQVDEMMKAAENNPIKALQGRVAGMTVTTNGNPSGSATVRIRGIGTLNNNDPLYVIDGIPTKSGMHELNSNDIENIQVLKDASAASIYGSRAANGVIIITTKKGSTGKAKVSFESYITSSWYNTKLDVLNAKEYGLALWQATTNSGGNPNDNNIGYMYDWGYNNDGNAVLNNMYLPKYIDSDKTMLTSDTDWFDEVSRKGFAQSYNLSVSNGNDAGHYYLSAGYYKNDGLIRHSNFDRFSVRMNSDYKLFNNALTIGENFTVNKTSELQAPGDVLDLALKAMPLIPVHTVDGKGWGGPANGMNDRQNPVRLLDANKDNAYSYWRTFGNFFINLEPVKNLNFKSNFGVDYGNFFKRYLQHSYVSGYLESDLNAVNLEQSHWMKWTWSNTVSYAREIGNHKFDLLGGMETFKENNIDFSAYKEGFETESANYMWPNVGTGTSNTLGGATGYSLLSYFGKVNYSFADRYLASGTIRYDGSSRFGKNNRFGTFPAFSVGWRLSEENFMSSVKDVVSDLKLRVGWGQTGNQEISNTAIYTIYVPDYGTSDPTWNAIRGTAYDINGSGSGTLASGFKLTQRGNDDLKWETTTQTNIGVDFGLWSQMIYGSAEYYIKKTEDILVLPPYLAAIGEGGNRWLNGASMENKGYEVSVGVRKQTSFGLTYDIMGNISGYKNKVTKLPEDVENSYGGNGKGDNILGRPLGSFYGYVADGLFRTQEEVDNHVIQEGKGLGRIRYKNLKEDDKISDDDRTWIGSPHPDFSYGLNINLEYKNFDLSAFFQGVVGIDIVNDLKYQTDFWSIHDSRSNKGTRLLNAWSPSNHGSDIPALQSLNVNDEGRFSTYFIENGSYLKLRNIQLGYTLPKAIAGKMKMERLRLYVSGQNLMTLTSKNFTGVDPENPGFGYPIPVTFTAGLNVSF
jgi:TonB-linked SusC/RagA family outer membrane protein